MALIEAILNAKGAKNAKKEEEFQHGGPQSTTEGSL